MALKIRRSRVHTNTLLAEQINEKRAGLVVPVGKGRLLVLVLLDILHVLVEKVGRVERAALGFRVELSTEDGARVVDEAFIGLVIQIGEVLPPIARQCQWINRVSVVLRSDVALSSRKV